MSRSASKWRTVAAVSALAAVAACGGNEPGSPTAARNSTTAETTTAGPTSSAPTSTDEPSGGDTALAALDPCTIIPASEMAGFGFTRPGSAEEVLGAKLCTWPEPGRSVSIALDPSAGLQDLNTGSATSVEEITVGGHFGRRVVEAEGPGFCSIDLGVSENSSVTVTSINFEGTPIACEVADRVAASVEPKLP